MMIRNLRGKITILALAGIGLLAWIGAVQAEITIIGADKVSHTFSQSDVAALASVESDSHFQTEHGPEQAHYKGPLLWTVLAKFGMADEAGTRNRLPHGLLVTGRDGYAVLLSFGETDPAFEGKPVILAFERDGKPISEGQLRLVVPGDKKGGRAVRDVTEIRFQ